MSANTPTGAPDGRSGTGSALTNRLARPRVIVGTLITVLAVWFFIANNAPVRIHLWFWWVSARLWIVLLLTFLAGALVGLLFAQRHPRRRR